MDNNRKTNPDWNKRVVQVPLTKMEGALIKQIRDLKYGKYELSIVKIDGEPIRIEINEKNMSVVLDGRDGLELEDSIYIDERVNFNKSVF